MHAAVRDGSSERPVAIRAGADAEPPAVAAVTPEYIEDVVVRGCFARPRADADVPTADAKLPALGDALSTATLPGAARWEAPEVLFEGVSRVCGSACSARPL